MMKTIGSPFPCSFAAMLILPFLSLFSIPVSAQSNIMTVLQPYIDRHELAGAVTLVATKDKVLAINTIGYADIAAKKPMNADSVFWIASMSKPIAATAMMMLVDEGKVRLDDSVEKYLPHFTPKVMVVSADHKGVTLRKPEHPILVRNILSHTSGVPFSSSIERPTLDVYPLAVRVESYAVEPLLFEPGSDSSYSNAGINIGARIIEVVSGMKYEDFLQQRIFNPLGMKDTTFWPNEAQIKRLAKSYMPNEEGTDLVETSITQLRYPLNDQLHRFEMPAGGLFSTASDLGRFCRMLLNGGEWEGRRYVSAAAIKEMATSVRPPDEKGVGYGLGWTTRPGGRFTHGGAYSTNMSVDPAHGLITVWLVQHADFPGYGRKSQLDFEKEALALAAIK